MPFSLLVCFAGVGEAGILEIGATSLSHKQINQRMFRF